MSSRLSSKRLEYILRLVPGLAIWVTFALFIFLSFFAPLWVVFLIIIYDVYWLVKALTVSVHLISAYRHLVRNQHIDWMERLEKMKDIPAYVQEVGQRLKQAEDAVKAISFLSWNKKQEAMRAYKKVAEEYGRITLLASTGVTHKNWNELYQLLVLPTSKEDISVLDESLRSITQSIFPLKQMIFVLATEARFPELATQNAAYLEKKYSHLFYKFIVATHPADTVGEAKVKGANVTYALRQAKSFIDQQGIAYENIVASVFDADTQPSPEYFSCLAYHYLSSDKPTRRSYQPIPMYDNNLNDTPPLMRVVAIGHSFWHMIESSRPERLCTFSSHSMSFRALVDVDFYPVNVVSDDSRIFYRCLLHYNGDYQVEPIFITVSMDAVARKDFFRTIANQYKQMNRWAWGVENFPYVLTRMSERPEMKRSQKFIVAWRLFESNYTWATAALIISFGGWLPSFLGGDEFQKNVISQNFLLVAQVLTTTALVGLFVCVIISLLLLTHKKAADSKAWYITALQWALIPITTILFGCLPAIDAQTRLMLGKNVGFVITEKTRKKALTGAEK